MQYNPSTSLIRDFMPLASFCACAAQFVLDMVANQEDRFSHDEVQIINGTLCVVFL